MTIPTDPLYIDPARGDAVFIPDPRRGGWLQTFTGGMFWPLDPRVEDVRIADIAHALAHQCRYAGHVRRFYSVAEHCVLMARAVPFQHRLWALLHDASEAYLVDLPRPVKRHVVGYADAETAVMDVICLAFGLDPAMPAVVHQADRRILTDERLQAMARAPMPWGEDGESEPLGVTLQFWTPVMAEIQFMTLFDMLMAGRLAAGAGLNGAGKPGFNRGAAYV